MVARTPTFIDALSLTVPVRSRSDQVALTRWFDTERSHSRVHTSTRHNRPKSGNYRHSYWLQLPHGEECLVELHPTRAEGNYMRLEFNPARAPEAIPFISNVLNEILPSFTFADLRAGRVTRVHITFDVRGLTLAQFDAFGMLRRREVRAWQTEFSWSPEGRLTGIEIGEYQSPTSFLVYDKAAELMYRRSGPPRLIRSRIRFELRLRGSRSIESFLLRDNPFHRYVVYSHELIAPMARTTEERYFLMAVRGLGAQVVLSQERNQRRRDALRSLLITPPLPTYWQPDQVWSEFGALWAAMFDL